MRLGRDDGAQAGEHDRLVAVISDALCDHAPEKVGVAVSGGGDSMALLDATIRWATHKMKPIAAATVDHGLRADAPREAADVARFCQKNSIEHTTLNWDGRSAQGNVQAAGRVARYDLIAHWAKSRGITHILLGHTADDIAETFLMRLSRKSGVDGLAAMAPTFQRNGVTWLRPLLGQSRADLRIYLEGRGIAWVDDPSNEDLSQTRPQARKILQALGPLGIEVSTLTQTAQALSVARDALQTVAVHAADKLVSQDAGDVIIAADCDPSIPAETRRRLQVAALQYVNGAPYPPRETALAHLDAALKTQHHHTVAGCLVSKQDGALRYGRELNAVQGDVYWTNRRLAVMWDGRWLLREDEGQNTQGHLIIRALGSDLKDVPDWRATGLPRATLMASPSVWCDGVLIAAPLAGVSNGFHARIVTDFTSFLLSR